MKRKIHNFVIKALTALNAFSLIYWICWIDCIISWQPYVIMLVNFTWICLVLYANGWMMDTEPYYERLKKKKVNIMMKCKITMEENRECQNCCFFCDKKDTCEDVCGEMEEKCEEQVEETDLQVIQSAVPDVLKAITDITVQKKKLDEQEKVMKKKLQEAMETYGVKSFETPEVKFLYVAPTTRTTIDSKKLKADHPDIAEAYSKTSNVSASVRITVK